MSRPAFSESWDQPGAELFWKQRDPGGVILGGPLTCRGRLKRELVNKVREEQKQFNLKCIVLIPVKYKFMFQEIVSKNMKFSKIHDCKC